MKFELGSLVFRSLSLAGAPAELIHKHAHRETHMHTNINIYTHTQRGRTAHTSTQAEETLHIQSPWQHPWIHRNYYKTVFVFQKVDNNSPVSCSPLQFFLFPQTKLYSKGRCFKVNEKIHREKNCNHCNDNGYGILPGILEKMAEVDEWMLS